MAKININCPNCKARFKVDEIHLGKKARCQKCGEKFVISHTEDNNETISGDSKSRNEVTQPAEPTLTQPIEATIRQDSSHGSVETIPSPKAGQDSDDIAVTIAAPSEEKGEVKIHREEQDVPVEWEEGQTILNLYEVKHVHRTGGMGLVYKVHHKNWNIDLAVKSPRGDFFKTETQKENFIHECETWINLGLHPNIVSCYYVRTLGGIPRVFAEYVEDGSLKDWIDNKKLYEGEQEKALERILDIAIQFAWGLQYSHEKDLVHQDVKPANVMMTDDGTAKVTDFGLAKARAASESLETNTQQNILVSTGGMTPAYCSPEQANKQSLSRKTDIWSWGLSILEMFAGEVFWRAGQAAPEALESFLEMGANDEEIPKIPEELVKLLKKCFQRNPDDRPKDTTEIAERSIGIYKENVGEEYARPVPKTVDLLADGLNNKAVSMLDLGRKEEAEKIYEEALKVDLHHPEATYNRGLLLWRSGRMTDDQLVKQLEEIRTTHQDDWRDEYVLGLVHIERGDAESAVGVLEEATKQAPGEIGVQTALSTAKAGIGKWGKCLRKLENSYKGHHGLVKFDSTDNFFISASSDNLFRVWNLANGMCVRTLETPGVPRALSSDGRFAAIFCSAYREPGKILIWDVEHEKCIRTLEESGPWAAFTNDGHFLLSHYWGRVCKLWNLIDGKCVKKFDSKVGKSDVRALAVSGDGRMALVIRSGQGYTAQLFDLISGKLLHSFEGHTKSITCITFSDDGRFALSGSEDSTLRLWDVANGRCSKIFKGHTSNVNCVALSAEGRFAISGGRDNTIRLWDIESGKCIRTFKDHPSEVSYISISNNSKFALSVGACSQFSSDYIIFLWSLTTSGKQQEVLSHPLSYHKLEDSKLRVNDFKLQAIKTMKSGNAREAYEFVNQAMLIPGYSTNPELLDLKWDIGCFGRAKTLLAYYTIRIFKDYESEVQSVAFCSRDQLAVTASRDQKIRLLQLDSGKCLKMFEDVKSTAGGIWGMVKFSYNGSLGAWIISDGNLQVGDIQKGKILKTISGISSQGEHIQIGDVSQDGRWIILIHKKPGRPPKVYFELRDLTDGHQIWVGQEKQGQEIDISFSRDARFLICAYGYLDGGIVMLDTATGKSIWRRSLGNEGTCCDAISPNNNFIVARNEGIVHILELDSGKTVRSFEAPAEFSSFFIHPNGKFLFSISPDDHIIHVLEFATGKCIQILEGHTARVLSVAFSSDGRFGLSVSSDKTVRLWRFVWDYEFPALADWDKGARPYLETFLTLYCPYGPDGISRVGKPIWNDEDFKKLLKELQYCGYGWLRPEGVRKKLKEMTANWQGPPPLPGQE